VNKADIAATLRRVFNDTPKRALTKEPGMKILITVITCLFTVNAFAARIDCTTRMTKGRTDKTPKVTICGAVGENIKNNGIKYRRIPRSCEKFSVEFFSIRRGDDQKFSSYCDNIGQKNCYMVGIRDTTSRQGMAWLSSYMVFSSVEAIPASFSLGASGTGHKQGLPPGPGTSVRLDLSCRVKP
jgi:hypothetical protein